MGKALLLMVATLFLGVFFWPGLDAGRAQRVAEREKQSLADQQPHVIREVDGCKVYRFMDGGYWRYFTRCATQTTTEYRLRSGKSSRPESITTENRD